MPYVKSDVRTFFWTIAFIALPAAPLDADKLSSCTPLTVTITFPPTTSFRYFSSHHSTSFSVLPIVAGIISRQNVPNHNPHDVIVLLHLVFIHSNLFP